MKKILLLLSLSLLLTSSLSFAQDENDSDELNVVPPTVIQVTNDSTSQHAIWVTIYNAIGRISDTACVQPDKRAQFYGYMPPFTYGVRAEAKENSDCGGATLADERWDLPIVAVGIDIKFVQDHFVNND